MLKYTDILVTFSEVPDEIALCINISNCPYHCPECHSKELWQDIGQRLTAGTLVDLMTTNPEVTCICFMGGDSDLEELYNLFKFIPMLFKNVKIAWYTGREDIPKDLPPIDYIKIGPYKSECGPLHTPKSLGNDYIIVTTKKFWEDIIKESLKISNKWSQSLEKKVDN